MEYVLQSVNAVSMILLSPHVKRNTRKRIMFHVRPTTIESVLQKRRENELFD